MASMVMLRCVGVTEPCKSPVGKGAIAFRQLTDMDPDQVAEAKFGEMQRSSTRGFMEPQPVDGVCTERTSRDDVHMHAC